MPIELVIYLVNRLPSIGDGLFVCFLLGMTFTILIFLNNMDNAYSEKDIQEIKKNLCRRLKYLTISLVISLLIPSEKTMYLMLGANYLKNSTLPSKVELAIEKKIDSYLQEKP